MNGRLLQLVLIGILFWVASILGMLAVLMTAKPAHAEEKPWQLRGVETDHVHILIAVHHYAAYAGSGVVRIKDGKTRLFLLPECLPEGWQLSPEAMHYEAKAQLACMDGNIK